MTFLPQEVIARKRDGLALTSGEIQSFIAGLTDGSVSHAQAAAFRDSLPVAGVDGTLERRLRGTAAESRVFAKTGTLRQSSALAGYVDAKSGARFVFSIVANHHTGPSSDAVAAIDAVVEALAGY